MTPAPKPIVFSTPLIANFLWHMLAVGKIGYSSDYADTFRHTVSASHLALLDKHRTLLKFGEGEGGELSAFFAMFPAWLPISSNGDLAAYFRALRLVLKERSLLPLTEAFPNADWRDRFVAHDLVHFEFADNLSAVGEIADELAEAYLASFDKYCDLVWPLAVDPLKARAALLNDHFEQRDYIAEWENLLGIPFASSSYNISLCFANKNGPDYNSLGYCGNLIYYDKPFDRTCQFISHEIGTHLMIDTLLHLRADSTIDQRALYGAYESLAMFFNRRLLNLPLLAYQLPQFDDSRRLEIYERLFRPGIPLADLIRAAL